MCFHYNFIRAAKLQNTHTHTLSLLQTSKVRVLLLHLADAQAGISESVSLTLLFSGPVFHPRVLTDDILIPEDTRQ